MVTESVPARASSGSIAQALWFSFLVRAALALRFPTFPSGRLCST
jgi:hypothetical protein